MRLLAGATVLFILLLGAYWPALRGGFVFDDDTLVMSNPLVLASDGLFRIWFTGQAIDYWPMTNGSFWLEWRLWGSTPTGYHATNIVLHFLSALLLWALLRHLNIRGAFLGAALFCLHPVNVQSVAWIAQRKNTLSMVFFLVSAYCFVRSERVTPGTPGAPGTPRTYGLSVAAFILAMLSKGSVVVLPALLLLLAWWQRGEVTRKDVIRVLPFVVIGIGLTVVNVWFQHRFAGSIRDLSPLERLLGAGAAVWFYLSKAILPINLAFIYPQWTIETASAQWWPPLVAAILVTVLLGPAKAGLYMMIRHRPTVRALTFAWTFFLVALIPVMGFADVYFMKYSAVADHYQYIAMIAVVVTIAAAVASITRPMLAAAVGGALVTACVLLTWQQSRLYAEPEHFYRTSLAANPSSWALKNNLGALLVDQHRDDEAVGYLREAVRANPNMPAAHNNLCLATSWLRRFDDALDDCALAIRLDPTFADGHRNLAIALMSYRRYDEAKPELEAALAVRPDDAEALYYLGYLLLASGQPGAALRQYEEMMRLTPASAPARNGAGMAERDLGNLVAAEQHFRAALALQPDFEEARQNLDALKRASGRAGK